MLADEWLSLIGAMTAIALIALLFLKDSFFPRTKRQSALMKVIGIAIIPLLAIWAVTVLFLFVI
jgi:cell division protein FtsX